LIVDVWRLPRHTGHSLVRHANGGSWRLLPLSSGTRVTESSLVLSLAELSQQQGARAGGRACRDLKAISSHQGRSTIKLMKLAHGTVVSGKVVLDDDSLPDGANVYVFAPRSVGPARLAPDELAELEAALAEEAAGETVSGDEFLKELRTQVER
jgi:hypothetical protein